MVFEQAKDKCVCPIKDGALLEAQRIMANKEVIIEMLKGQIKKLEEQYKLNLKQTESYRYKYCVANEQIKKLCCKQETPKEPSPQSSSSNKMMEKLEKSISNNSKLLEKLSDRLTTTDTCECDATKFQEEIRLLKDENAKLQDQIKNTSEKNNEIMTEKNGFIQLLPNTLKTNEGNDETSAKTTSSVEESDSEIEYSTNVMETLMFEREPKQSNSSTEFSNTQLLDNTGQKIQDTETRLAPQIEINNSKKLSQEPNCNKAITNVLASIEQQKQIFLENFEKCHIINQELARNDEGVKIQLNDITCKIDLLLSNVNDVIKNRDQRNSREIELTQHNLADNQVNREETTNHHECVETLNTRLQSVEGHNQKLKESISSIVNSLKGQIGCLKEESRRCNCSQTEPTATPPSEIEKKFKSASVVSSIEEVPIEDIYKTVLCSCVQKQTVSDSVLHSTMHTESIQSCCDSYMVLEERCEGQTLVENLHTYVAYLNEQLEIIANIEGQIEEMKEDIKKSKTWICNNK